MILHTMMEGVVYLSACVLRGMAECCPAADKSHVGYFTWISYQNRVNLG